MAKLTQANRILTLTTVLPPETLAIQQISGEESLGRPFRYTVSVVSESEELDFDKVIGTAVGVSLSLGPGEGEGFRYFHGVVSGVTHTGYSGRGHARYDLSVVPWLDFARHSSNCRIFQRKTVPEILESVFGEYSSEFDLSLLSGNYPMRDYCVQYRESDLNFVQRLMEHEGIYYFWEHKEGGSKMILCDGMSQHQTVKDYEKLLYRSYQSGVEVADTLSSWNFRKVVTPGSYLHNSFDFENPFPTPNARLTSRGQKAHSFAGGDYEVYDNEGGFETTAEGERLAIIRREELQVQTQTIVSQTNARGLICGAIFTPQELPGNSDEEEFLIISTSFSANSGDFETGGASGGEVYQCSMSVIPKKSAVFRPSRSARLPRVSGPQTAFVVGPSGEEIFVDEFGRIKVQFHWDLLGKYDDNSSCWLRVAQSCAGKGWGGISLPRVGHEVIVEFLEGDPDRPIVTGRVYNGEANPPYKLPKDKTVSTFKTNSTPGGGGFNELRFEDKAGKEQIFVHAQRNRDLRVTKDNLEWVGENEHRIVVGDSFASTDGDCHLTIGGEQNEKVGETYSLKTGRDLYQKAGSNLGQEAGMDVHLKGGMNVVIEAGIMITLKAGPSFVTVGPAGVSISGPLININSGGSAGSGSGCSPTAPTAPKEADSDKAGKKVATIAAKKVAVKKSKVSATATVLREAAKAGTPFCEKCEEAKRAQAAGNA